MPRAKRINCEEVVAGRRRPFKYAKPLSGDRLALIQAASEKSHKQYLKAYKRLAKF